MPPGQPESAAAPALTLKAQVRQRMTSSTAWGAAVISDPGRSWTNSEHGTGTSRDAPGLLSGSSCRHGRRGLHRSFCRAVPALYRRADGATAERSQHRWDPDRFSCASEASSEGGSQKSGHLSTVRRAAGSQRLAAINGIPEIRGILARQVRFQSCRRCETQRRE